MSKKKLDTNRLLSEQTGWARDPRFPEIARVAGKLAKANYTWPEIQTQLAQSFGNPPEKTGLKSRDDLASIAWFGSHMMDSGVFDQVKLLARVPGVKQVAVMPDAHVGKGATIGSVIKTEGIVMPAAVGVDIGCSVSFYPLAITSEEFEEKKQYIFETLKQISHFGFGGFGGSDIRDHWFLDTNYWQRPPLKGYKDLARSQWGTSGGGNHFIDVVVGDIDEDCWVGKKGERVAGLLLHSGSRGTGAKIAKMYQEKAIAYTRAMADSIPPDLAWLSLETEEGEEYLRTVAALTQWAGYNHEVIATQFEKASGIQVGTSEESITVPHNTVQVLPDNELITRKGAVYAAEGQLVIIPGTSASRSVIGIGLGNRLALESCSHGVGRPHSRAEAKRQHDPVTFEKAFRGVLMDGVAPDEGPDAYKNAEQVFAIQLMENLFRPAVWFEQPAIVLMGGKSDDGD